MVRVVMAFEDGLAMERQCAEASSPTSGRPARKGQERDKRFQVVK
jgi:hypothetical protein